MRSPTGRLARVMVPMLTCCLAFAISPARADDSGPDPKPPLGPQPSAAPTTAPTAETPLLRRGGSGRAVLRALGDKVKEAAARNNMPTERLRQIFTTDPTAHLGRHGRMYYVEPEDHAAEAAAAETGPTSSAATMAGAIAPLADTFTLHSNDSSSRTIYLDFDGIDIGASEGSWWVDYADAPLAAGSYTGFTLDGSAAFSDTELAYIQQVWQIVAEKYAPFDVDVTTEDPGPAGYNRTSYADSAYGTHVVITDDPSPRSQICGSCAGVAWVDVFDNIDAGQAEPAWVFSSATSGSPVLTANAAAHEVGHTLGLSHDGTSSVEYYSGHANWVPIMGITNGRAVAQFSTGEYSGANNTEDDLAIIAGSGAPLLSDDVPGVKALGTATSYTTTGIIGTRADTDTFSITRPCEADLTATATGIGFGQALDLKLEILNGDGSAVLASDNPASGQVTAYPASTPTGLDASAEITGAPAGDYRIRVDGVGSGDPFNTGYSDYGSLGGYLLQISGCADAGGDPPGAPSSISASAHDGTDTGQVSWTAPADPGDGSINGYTISGVPGGPYTVGAATLSQELTGLNPGSDYTVRVRATSEYGEGSSATAALSVPTYAPTGAAGVRATVEDSRVTLALTAPANPGNATQTRWEVVVKRGSTVAASNTNLPASTAYVGITGLGTGAYTATVTPVYDADLQSGDPAGSTTFSIATRPGKPPIRKAYSGKKGGKKTATARWGAAASHGAPITRYQVRAYKLNKANKVMRTFTSKKLKAGARKRVMGLPAGRYRFRVRAFNRVGASAWSKNSRIVRSR